MFRFFCEWPHYYIKKFVSLVFYLNHFPRKSKEKILEPKCIGKILKKWLISDLHERSENSIDHKNCCMYRVKTRRCHKLLKRVIVSPKVYITIYWCLNYWKMYCLKCSTSILAWSGEIFFELKILLKLFHTNLT